MNKTRRILFFDIDGTLITDDGKRYFPDSAKEAIQKARENGHLAFINTGRTLVSIEPRIREIGFIPCSWNNNSHLSSYSL